MTLRARRLPSGFWKGSSGRKTTRRSKTTRAVKSLAPRARKAVATIAKRVMARGSESHYVARYPSGEDGYSAIYGDVLPTGGVGQLFTCLPQVAQGDKSYERNGLKLNPTKHRTDLRFVFNDDPLIGPSGTPIARAGWDITIHIWYGYVRRFKNTGDIATTALTNEILASMFDDGLGNLQRFTGILADETLQQNKEFVSLKHKKVRMYKNAGQANVLDTVSPSLSTPMSEAKRVSLSFKPPKTLLYADEGNLFPENYAPFFVVGYCHNDGTQASNKSNTGITTDLLELPAVKMFQVDKLWFKDH